MRLEVWNFTVKVAKFYLAIEAVVVAGQDYLVDHHGVLGGVGEVQLHCCADVLQLQRVAHGGGIADHWYSDYLLGLAIELAVVGSGHCALEGE